MPRIYTSSSDTEEEEEYTPSRSQRKSQQSSEDVAKYAGLVCNYLLLAESKKVPAKRTDIIRGVMKEHGRHFPAVIDKAADFLQEVYGYKIVALKKKFNYILVNSIGHSHSDNDNDDATKMGLLTAILAAIFMTGEVMQEGPMREYLKKFNVHTDSKEVHPVFGNVSRFINQEFVKQKYIDITQDTTVDPPIREYRWGERAHQEISKRDMLDLVCKVYGNNMRPEIWTAQWKTVENEKSAQDSDLGPSRSCSS